MRDETGPVMQPVAPLDPAATSGPPGVDGLQTYIRWAIGALLALALSLALRYVGGDDLSPVLKANTDKIDAVAAQLTRHQSAMDADQAARLERERHELELLSAICKGVNRGNRAAEDLCRAY